MSEHAILAASAADKWLACPASVALERALGVKDSSSSDYAREGTAAHSIAEKCLNDSKVSPFDFVGKDYEIEEKDENGVVVKYRIPIDRAIAEAIETYVNYAKHIVGDVAFTELRVDYSHYVPKGFGTADRVILVVEDDDSCTMHVIDLKFGAGLPVYAYENNQERLYAIGALKTLDLIAPAPIKKVVLHICQPRKNNITEWETTADELLEWASTEVAPKAQLAWKLCEGDPMALKPRFFNPTEKGCQWCKGKGQCKALATQAYEAVVDGFSDLTEEEKPKLVEVKVSKATCKVPGALSTEELAKLWNDKKVILSFFKALDEHILAELMKGTTIKGLKPVMSEGNRVWIQDEKGEVDKELVVAAMRTAGLKKDDYEVLSLISPTKAEDTLKEKHKDWAKRMEKLTKAAIVKAEGKPSIAKESDKKPSIAPIAGGIEDTDVEDVEILNDAITLSDKTENTPTDLDILG